MPQKRPRAGYYVLIGKVWWRAEKAQEQPSGWLHWEIHEKDHLTGEFDVTTGMSKPGDWKKLNKNKEITGFKVTGDGPESLKELFRF